MNEQQLAAVKQALELMHNRGDVGVDEWIAAEAALQSIISQDALHKMAEESRTSGLRLDDWPKIGCVNHDCDKCKAVQEPVAWMQEDGEHFSIWKDKYATVPLYTTPPAPPVQEPVARYCCHSCFKASGGVMLDRMILCPECGNKRCPKASDHQLDCTGSNEAGQHGSVYTAPQPVPVKTYHDGKPWPVAPKPWVGLTDDEIRQCETTNSRSYIVHARAIEARLKEKNHDQ